MCEANTAQVAPGGLPVPAFSPRSKPNFDPRTGDPQPLDDITAASEKRLASDASDFNQQEPFRALADYLAVVKHDDWYFADEDQIFRLVRTASRAFDRSCAGAER